MRRHLYLVIDHDDEDRVGMVKITEKKMTRPTKNEKGPVQVLDDDGDRFKTVGSMVGMGYADFESDEAYEEEIEGVIKDKLRQVDDEYLEAAGVTGVIEE